MARGIIARSCISRFIPRLLVLLLPGPALAHGFGQRFDLPLPLWLWVTGAGATVVLTFAALALFLREATLPAARPPRAALPPLIAAPLRALAVLLFGLTLAAGFFGVQDPYRNLITTMVWVVWWVGLAFVCALIGDLWALANPLRTLFPRRLSLGLAYPERLGVWPAVALFLAFAWAELVWRENDVPASLACAVLGYAVVTWLGMLLYGRDTWLARGEAFSLAFGLLARFSVFGRRPAHAVSFSFMVFVLLMLATVSFDGFLETPLMQRIETAALGAPATARLLFALSEWGLDEAQLVASAALLAFPLAFVAAYWLASWAMARLSGPAISTGGAARAFVLTLVPIAVAYHLAHYFSLLATAGQFIIPLASDPFGFGWDLFGTARYKVDLGVLSPYVFWYGAVSLIVLGHVLAVLDAHRVALRLFGGPRAALVGQLPMVALMVAYTMLSLWILAQPIVG
jgi:hypothetical protein